MERTLQRIANVTLTRASSATQYAGVEGIVPPGSAITVSYESAMQMLGGAEPLAYAGSDWTVAASVSGAPAELQVARVLLLPEQALCPTANGATLSEIFGTNAKVSALLFECSNSEGEYGYEDGYATESTEAVWDDAWWHFVAPALYTGGDVPVTWRWFGQADANSVFVSLRATSFGDEDDLDVAPSATGADIGATGTGNGVSLGATANSLKVVSETWSTGLPTAGKLVRARVRRHRDNFADDSLVDHYLLALEFAFPVYA
jgi:hypothetical protein